MNAQMQQRQMRRRPQGQRPQGQNQQGGQNQKIVTDFFVYSPPIITSLAAGASQQVTVNIEADSNFELQKLTYYVDANATMTQATRVIPQMSLQITDQGSSRNLFNQAVPLSMVAGEGDLPFIMPVTKWFKRNSLVTFSIANFGGTDTYYNIYIAMIGKKVWGM